MVAIAEESVPDLPVRARARPVEVLFETERTRVSRVWLPDAGGSVIRKEPLGSGSVGRARHELRILGRLDDVSGVVRLVAGRAAVGVDDVVPACFCARRAGCQW